MKFQSRYNNYHRRKSIIKRLKNVGHFYVGLNVLSRMMFVNTRITCVPQMLLGYIYTERLNHLEINAPLNIFTSGFSHHCDNACEVCSDYVQFVKSYYRYHGRRRKNGGASIESVSVPTAPTNFFHYEVLQHKYQVWLPKTDWHVLNWFWACYIRRTHKNRTGAGCDCRRRFNQRAYS